ncbi:MAG TPA: DsbA family protein [Stellaceae bacterium]|jgi:protein-disulfide isomerase|nr:DsbA family protein [Stellaceae bacterium]
MKLSLRFLSLTIGLLGVLALAPRPVSAAEFTPDQRKAIEGIVRDYLANHPEMLIDALQAADEKLKGEARDKAAKALIEHKKEVFDDPNTPIAGNPKGDVTLVEFFDYRCPYCKQVEPALEKLVAEDRLLKVVFKEFPVLGPESEIAAHVALAAKKQGKYDAFHRAMMATGGHIDEAVIYKVAASVGLDVDRLRQDVKSADIAAQLKANAVLGNQLDISGTPAFVIGDTIVPGALSVDGLRQLIANARGKP